MSGIEEVFFPGTFVYHVSDPKTPYKVVKVNPRKTVVVGEDGRQLLGDHRGWKRWEGDEPQWTEVETVGTGELFKVPAAHPIRRKSWFNYTTSQVFISTKSDGAKMAFIPVGVKLPENSLGYTSAPTGMQKVTLKTLEVE